MVVGWDAAEGTHVYLPDADVAFQDGTLTFVGRGFAGQADTTIDGRGLMVMPGLVNIHTHPSSEPMNKGLTDEVRSKLLLLLNEAWSGRQAPAKFLEARVTMRWKGKGDPSAPETYRPIALLNASYSSYAALIKVRLAGACRPPA